MLHLNAASKAALIAGFSAEDASSSSSEIEPLRSVSTSRISRSNISSSSRLASNTSSLFAIEDSDLSLDSRTSARRNKASFCSSTSFVRSSSNLALFLCRNSITSWIYSEVSIEPLDAASSNSCFGPSKNRAPRLLPTTASLTLLIALSTVAFRLRTVVMHCVTCSCKFVDSGVLCMPPRNASAHSITLPSDIPTCHSPLLSFNERGEPFHDNIASMAAGRSASATERQSD
mmetsp:Transcript_55620/g.116373  ORF Transcript_55620/g.116373 Transcript_55620/m.116373 type:complete len:231 (-) Transcript_55620:596-1288(-)